LSRDIAKKAVSGTLWVAGVNYIRFAVTAVASIITARLVAPEAFGQYAMAGVFVFLAARFQMLGFDEALVHQPQPVAAHYSTHRVLNLWIYGAILALSIPGTWLIAKFYGRTVGLIFIALMVSSGVAAFSLTPSVILQKMLMYREIALIALASCLVASSLMVFTAWLGWGPWSLVAGTASGIVIGLIGNVMVCPMTIGWRYDKKVKDWFLSYGPYWRWFMGMSAQSLSQQFDSFTVGTVRGNTDLGFYSKALNWANLPTTQVAHVIASTAFPTYSRLQHDRRALSQAYQKVLSAVFRISLWIGLGMVFCAREGTIVLIGERWLPMVAVLRWMALMMLLRPFYDLAGGLLAAVGRPKAAMDALIWQGGWMVLTCFPMVHFWGKEGAAICVAVSSAVGIVVVYRQVLKEVDLDIKNILLTPFLAALVGLALMLGAYLFKTSSLVIQLLLKGGLLSVGYLLIVWLLEKDEWMNMWRKYIRNSPDEV
jgi:lipopolysaccharide exporter